VAQDTKQAVLLGSVLLNIILIAIFIWFVGYSRSTMLKFVSDAASNQIDLQERILTELSSGDPDRIAALTNSLHWSIEAQKRVRYKIETKDYRPESLP
jgi:hypothetical protein